MSLPSPDTADRSNPEPPPAQDQHQPERGWVAQVREVGLAAASDSAREHVAGVLAGHGIGEDARADVALLVGEVVGELDRHEHPATVVVDVDVDEHRTVTVTVRGGISDVAGRLGQLGADEPETAEAGRGLGVLDALSSTWGTQRTHLRTAVWFSVADDTAAGRAETAPPAGPGAEADPAGGYETIAAATEADLNATPEVVAMRAALLAQDATADAAARIRDDAVDARALRSQRARQAAAAIADVATQAAAVAQREADDEAADVARAAAYAAATLATSADTGDGAVAAVTAQLLAAIVAATADSTSDRTARTAAAVAAAVSTAAAVLAETAAADDAAQAELVVLTARAVRAVAAATAQRLDVDTAQRNDLAAVAHRTSTGLLSELRQSNRQLQRIGTHDRAVASALQQAMLTRLPDLPRMDLVARYLTAAHDTQVGGDWYDALSLAGKTTLVIGDVVGHDIVAAAAMGQLRNLLRALIWNDNDAPSHVVSRLDLAARDLRIDTMATLLVVTVEAGRPGAADQSVTLRWTNAGHPPPVLLHGDGTVQVLDAERNDMLLGVRPETVRHDRTLHAPSGSTLLLFTDGLIETRDQDLDDGLRRLTASVARHSAAELGPFLDAVIADMVGDDPDDDVALLAARFR